MALACSFGRSSNEVKKVYVFLEISCVHHDPFRALVRVGIEVVECVCVIKLDGLKLLQYQCFLLNLFNEVSLRLNGCGVQGLTFTLKVAALGEGVSLEAKLLSRKKAPLL
ncbi:DNA repair protein REV1 [Cucumis melo var. makuwa]|uniref:DNA repair protein REV1 n=1 Tax=Cucumis melo var. makuwa TaxID=1194695 RepID=A0A5A7UXR9_CUCMM|nr:DNA repair protein REV1 [Cucumis melo var. makuwa]